jgi:putative addiction module component (TIGR02574 family)
MKREILELYRQAAGLPECDRATLAGLLIESLEPEEDAGVEEEWRAEVSRRVRQIEAGEVELESWESVRDRMTRRLNEAKG